MSNPDQMLIEKFLAGERSPLPIDSHAAARTLGATLLELDKAKRTIVVSFRPSDELLNGIGLIQGGVVASMLDLVMAFAGLALLKPDQGLATITLNTNLMSAAPQGTYIARAVIDKLGRTIAFASATLETEDGKIIANGTSSMSVFAARSLA